MKLATIRTARGHAAARIEDDQAVEIGVADVNELLARPDWRTVAAAGAGPRHDLAVVDYAPVVPRPSKIICVGLNYRSHILEMGHDLPAYPTLFAKFTSTLIGAKDDLVLPEASKEVDWEAELALIVGKPASGLDADEAGDAIAGYTLLNDFSMRDWQHRTGEWLQGKAFDATTPVGPWLVTPDEVGNAADLEISCTVDGTVRQRARTGDLLFTPADLVSYISRFTTLQPGDLISTGTPGGVGHAHSPRLHLRPDQVVITAIEGLGRCRNRCVAKSGHA